MSNIPPIRVRTDQTPERRFERSFQIGRRQDADVPVQNEYVSRSHVEVVFQHGRWWAVDLGSANGIFVAGQRQPRVPVDSALSLRLGAEGPFVYLAVDAPPPLLPPPSGVAHDKVAEAIGRYFSPEAGATAGEHTMVVRQAFEKVKRREKRRYGGVIAGLLVCALAAGAYAYYLHRQDTRRTEMALELFYTMKSLDVDIAGVEKLVQEAGTAQGGEQLARFRRRREDMEREYQHFVAELGARDAQLTPKQKLVTRIVRIFGESDLAMPREFLTEIDRYVALWQASGRLTKALDAARANGYLPVIAQELLAQGLPPQFLYLALQESNFEPFASGPPTRSGIAKGMWQFVPKTAVKYGLKLGPLVDLPRPDPADDRHNWERASRAAASYLKDLYSTDAQASGFLVMSCYNWGEEQVLPLIKKLPANPRERNFWRLLAGGKERIPKETYDYVFYIASAAVIGENPRLFGFDFGNPLAFLEQTTGK